MKKVLFVGMVCVLGWMTAQADDKVEKIRTVLQKAIPGAQPDTIVPSPATGMYEVTYGAEIYYVTEDAKYMIQGDVIDIQQKKNLTESKRSAGRKALMTSVSESDMIVFSPKQVKYRVTVFTDVDCTFCRRMHQEIAEYNNNGIEIRYLLYPRTGLNSPSYYKAQSVWCSGDRKRALTEAKLGKNVAEKKCSNPIEKTMKLASQIGLEGTPTLVLENGTVLGGYVPPVKLKELLESGYGS
ncbi:MAG: DsbC family protein [Gammaproteobacteria bacterium]|nr:DsbC family protein [Gammaproteobacteria bacterium]